MTPNLATAGEPQRQDPVALRTALLLEAVTAGWMVVEAAASLGGRGNAAGRQAGRRLTPLTGRRRPAILGGRRRGDRVPESPRRQATGQERS